MFKCVKGNDNAMYPRQIFVVYVLQFHVDSTKHISAVKLHNIRMGKDGEAGVSSV